MAAFVENPNGTHRCWAPAGAALSRYHSNWLSLFQPPAGFIPTASCQNTRAAVMFVPSRLYRLRLKIVVFADAADLLVGRNHAECPNRPENWSSMRRLNTTPVVFGEVPGFGLGLLTLQVAVPMLAVVTVVSGEPGRTMRFVPAKVTVQLFADPLTTAEV